MFHGLDLLCWPLRGTAKRLRHMHWKVLWCWYHGINIFFLEQMFFKSITSPPFCKFFVLMTTVYFLPSKTTWFKCGWHSFYRVYPTENATSRVFFPINAKWHNVNKVNNEGIHFYVYCNLWLDISTTNNSNWDCRRHRYIKNTITHNKTHILISGALPAF